MKPATRCQIITALLLPFTAEASVPTENVPAQRRSVHETENSGCQWSISDSFTNLTGCSVRYKLTDIEHLYGRVSGPQKAKAQA